MMASIGLLLKKIAYEHNISVLVITVYYFHFFHMIHLYLVFHKFYLYLLALNYRFNRLGKDIFVMGSITCDYFLN
jgi:hypothetical protein